MATGSIDVRVENQLVRFVCPTPLDHERVVAEVGGQRNSGVVIKAMERPRARSSSMKRGASSFTAPIELRPRGCSQRTASSHGHG